MKLTNRTLLRTPSSKGKPPKVEDERHAFGVSTINPRMMDTVSFCEKCGMPVQVRYMNAHWKDCVRREAQLDRPKKAAKASEKKK